MQLKRSQWLNWVNLTDGIWYQSRSDCYGLVLVNNGQISTVLDGTKGVSPSMPYIGSELTTLTLFQVAAADRTSKYPWFHIVPPGSHSMVMQHTRKPDQYYARKINQESEFLEQLIKDQ